MKFTIFLLCGLFIGVMITTWVGAEIWKHDTTSIIKHLQEERLESEQGVVDLSEVDSLPQPVRRYFRYALRDGQSLIREAKLYQFGGFRTTPEASEWSDMHAIQHFFPSQSGFVWNARINMIAWFKVNVRDVYRNGAAAMTGKLAGIFPVVDEADDPELNAAALQRYLAEAVWFPTAMLPSQGVEWQPIDASSASATIRDGDNSASLVFHFAETGEVTRIFAADRYRAVDGEYLATPWTCHLGEYVLQDSMHVPSSGTVEWHLPEGKFAYWRGEITHFEYQY